MITMKYNYCSYWKLSKVNKDEFQEKLQNIVDDSYYKKSNIIKRKMTIEGIEFRVEIDKKNVTVIVL